MQERQKRITRVTLLGSFVNLVLTVLKIMAGVFGRSAAMVADGIHSLSDFASDIVVLVFVKISSKGKDENHDYGHGKFETLATLIVSLILVVVAAKLIDSGVRSIVDILSGVPVEAPSYPALVAAVLSILVKEWLYHYTARVGRLVESPVVVANAWHHRSDAISSVASLAGISGAMFLGDKWIILDPAVSCIIGIAIICLAVRIALPSVRELLEVSLPEEMENEILSTASAVDGVLNVHNLKTRRNGPSIIIDAHVVVDPKITVVKAHDISTRVEKALYGRFGDETQISIHIEPDEESE